MDYLSKLSSTNSLLCLGLDPVVEKIPLEGSTEKKITEFDLAIMEAAKPYLTTVKPNYAFYAQYGFDGLRALKATMEKAKALGFAVIFDGKRGDIGKTSEAYAREAFEFWDADSATISPYLGSDTISPFLPWLAKDRGIYVLVRTSNPSATELQDLVFDDNPLFLLLAEKVVKWAENGPVGAVVGATRPAELKGLVEFFWDLKVPLLIPGVGSQGGSAEEVAKILKGRPPIDRVNASSSILYAWEKENSNDFVGAALKEIQKLNRSLKI